MEKATVFFVLDTHSSSGIWATIIETEVFEGEVLIRLPRQFILELTIGLDPTKNLLLHKSIGNASFPIPQHILQELHSLGVLLDELPEICEDFIPQTVPLKEDETEH